MKIKDKMEELGVSFERRHNPVTFCVRCRTRLKDYHQFICPDCRATERANSVDVKAIYDFAFGIKRKTKGAV